PSLHPQEADELVELPLDVGGQLPVQRFGVAGHLAQAHGGRPLAQQLGGEQPHARRAVADQEDDQGVHHARSCCEYQASSSFIAEPQWVPRGTSSTWTTLAGSTSAVRNST